MRKMTAPLLALMVCLSLTACETAPEFTRQETQPVAETRQEPQQEPEIVGPWHLDEEKNDLAAFEASLELFPGYGEWGAGMEIRSNGQMSWHIGAEGWHGTYTLEDDTIQARLTSDLEQTEKLWVMPVTVQGGAAALEMPYQDMTIFWVYGDQEDAPMVYADRQGAGNIYSSLSLETVGDGYAVELDIPGEKGRIK